jgi:two-component system, OmpR family, sensor kinase
LRTPLTAIKGYAQLVLRQRRDEPPDDPTAESLRIIIGQADRLDQMTASLLDISRVRVGRVPLRRSVVDVRAIARRVFLEMPEVQTEADPADAPEARVDGDAARVSQIIRSMATFLATRDPRGTLSASVTTSDGRVRVAMLDDAAPVPADTAARLFERLVEPAPNSPTGWQLGRPDLYIARGLAHAHGGTLEVESPAGDSGLGVRLTLVLPLSG